VLLDEGEAYAAKLRLADVPVTTVRYDGTCHDFMLLNALSQTKAARAAIAEATAFLRGARTASSSRKTPAATIDDHQQLETATALATVAPVYSRSSDAAPKSILIRIFRCEIERNHDRRSATHSSFTPRQRSLRCVSI